MRRTLFSVALLALFSPFVNAETPAVKVEVLQTKLDHPWALAFLPDNRGMLITLRGGQLRHWQAGKGLSDPITGVPKVWANGQGDYWTWRSRLILSSLAASGSVFLRPIARGKPERR